MKIKSDLFSAWAKVLALAVVIVGGVVLIFGGGWLLFTWPMVVGAYVEDGVLTTQPDVSLPWKIAEGIWVTFLITGGIAYLISKVPSSDEGDSEPKPGGVKDSGKEVLGDCPRCGQEVEKLVEEDMEIVMETAWKCPKCDAILGVV